MESYDNRFMEEAVTLADQCRPIHGWIPRVGAVIAKGDAKLGAASRGSGGPNDDDHAELNALGQVRFRDGLAGATLYTTLEPCTPEVRSDPLHCCTEQILRAGIKKVFIGILDPNQGVTGKGLWQLQTHGVDVELFPPPFPERIRALNHEFIRLQQTPGIAITNPTNGARLETYKTHGAFDVEGTFENDPGPEILAFHQSGGKWWPASDPLTITGYKKWKVRFHFGGYGAHTLHIVKASPLGAHLVAYYRKIRDENLRRIEILRGRLPTDIRDQMLKDLPGSYPGINLGGNLPKGLQNLAMVSVEVVRPPAPAQ